jgi:hypothetical protein
MIKHFSKWLEVVLSPDWSNEGATYTFLDRIFNRSSVPVEVLIDQGIKFHGDFEKLCEKALIDHRTTSQNHLEVDGLTK